MANVKVTKACVEKIFEKVKSKINTLMNRLTNIFNSMVRSKILLVKLHVQSIYWYIVQYIQNCLKQPAINSIIGEGSKGDIKRHNILKFGIVRHVEPLGRRRIHNTINGKESSLICGIKEVLSGTYRNSQLQELRIKSKNREPIKIISQILLDPKFLMECWIRLKLKKNRHIKVTLTKNKLYGIDLKWFITIANSIKNGQYEFLSYKKLIGINKKKSEIITVFSIKKIIDLIVQEGLRYLLNIIYENRFINCSHGGRNKKGCYTALNYIKKTFRSITWFIKRRY